ncbi:hypothetical protein NDU88_008227 [Pleurodeles waltl]|uniref:Uncharacterized protein n=1 Tax=Pleurodeles waltl TaxID=8319 RepID=A0AAV7NX57_PLEWA|nr:hypothetical protein NDU88_008227 [Pleurodeles waltl]
MLAEAGAEVWTLVEEGAEVWTLAEAGAEVWTLVEEGVELWTLAEAGAERDDSKVDIHGSRSALAMMNNIVMRPGITTCLGDDVAPKPGVSPNDAATSSQVAMEKL